MTAQILVTVPKALNAADKAMLRKSGVVVIETNDPSTVRFITVEKPPLDSNDLFRAAMIAIAESDYSRTHETFTKNLAAIVKANHAAIASQPTAQGVDGAKSRPTEGLEP